ncbi:MAG: hypothetical protein LUC83_00885 [Clostridiales bacterium]|nr:hypothetical protein [Clostridiales bacterium]
MGEKIAMGFHTCVDYELMWDTEAVEKLIREFDIHNEELSVSIKLDSERSVLIACLAYFRDGIGTEMVPENPRICNDFANHFAYKVTIGGTAARAAIAISALGYTSALQMCCYNEHIRRLLPGQIQSFSSVGKDHTDVYPHVVLQCRQGVHVQANDIDFVTPRENRVMISRDLDSLQMKVSLDFAPELCDAEVFLLSCFSEVLDEEILTDRMEKTRQLLSHLPPQALVVMEDGHYVRKGFRQFVHRELQPVLDVLSMNEDEMQSYIGKRIDILNPEEVLSALKYVQEGTGVPTIIVHSSRWALAYGEQCGIMQRALTGGITMSATRFRCGDDLNAQEYAATEQMKDSEEGQIFCAALKERVGDSVVCLPCKDLSFVENPTVVGLGDSFAGGLLPGLLVENR